MSNGTVGEQRAEWFFKSIGWKMFRVQPPNKRVWTGKRLEVVNTKEGHGIADYVGYDKNELCTFIACEVKEFSGLSMPCSRLTKEQRDWMDNIPRDCSWVLGVRIDQNYQCYLWRYKPTGSYKC